MFYDALTLTSAVYVIKSQVLGLQRAFFSKKIQGSVVPRSIMTNMNYFEYQLCQPSNMPKLSHEKHEICLVPKMSSVSYNEQQLLQASNVPRSLMTNMNNFEYQLCQGSIMLSLNYENINYVMSQILKLSCVSFRYVSISYVLAFFLLH